MFPWSSERSDRPGQCQVSEGSFNVSQSMGMILCSMYSTFLDVGCLEAASLLTPVCHWKLSFDTKRLCFLMGRCSPTFHFNQVFQLKKKSIDRIDN